MATMKDVESIDDERHLGHGWWFNLRPGLKWKGYETHTIRRDTKRECLYELKTNVVPCNCDHCVKAP